MSSTSQKTGCMRPRARLDELHAAVEVGVDGQHERAVRDGLHQLRHADLVGRQEHDGGDARVRAVCAQRRARVA